MTGFLLAGVGNVDIRKKCNYLIVDSSTLSLTTVVLWLWWGLAGTGPCLVYASRQGKDHKPCQYFAETTTKQIESTFKDFTLRDDMGIILISQYVRCVSFVLTKCWNACNKSHTSDALCR